MKYNSVENAQVFITEQIEWCEANRHENFTIWSNGKELEAKLDEDTFWDEVKDKELIEAGFWKAIQYRNGHRVEY